MVTKTFETTYPTLPFAPLVSLGLALGRRLVVHRRSAALRRTGEVGAHA